MVSQKKVGLVENQLLQLLVLKVGNPGTISDKYEDPYILIILESSNRKD